ncbi:protein CNPPD1 [Procambarus clarkii]|uniref:protein CNPPD1 n=1 Tax=Procambarus clarkii TaxID=6728 RepID=UPI001E671E6B|nr:protein CNPPD1-like [Procambarus clarkii]
MKTPKTPDKLSSSQFSKFLPEYVDYTERIRKSLYYGRLPSTDRPSLPFTSLSVEKFSELCRQDGLEKLDLRYASSMCYDACVTPCSLILALVYLDRLRSHNPEYLTNTSPSQVFLVAMMVASKYLYDDGEDDEVFNDEWAMSAAVSLGDLNQAEKEFLGAIDWNLFVDAEAFLCAFERVEGEVAWREGEKRGYFTYADIFSLTHTLPVSCTSLLNLVSHVFAVCIVGYTAAIVSVVAGTLLARECSWHISTVMSQLSCNVSAANETTTTYLENITEMSYSDHLANSMSFFAENMEASLDDGKDRNISLSGFPSRAITTLTTSILLAMSSPSTLRHHQHRPHQSGRKNCRTCHSPTKKRNCQTQAENLDSFDSGSNLDPADTRLSFTTGPYWPPSSHSRRFGYLDINTLPSDLPQLEPSSIDSHASQKDDWVYSNPWVIPWLSWHSAPVYSIIHNFSGIGAPNMSGFKRSEHGWVDLLGRMCESVREIIDLIPLSHTVALTPSPLLGRVDVGYLGSDPVPWLL